MAAIVQPSQSRQPSPAGLLTTVASLPPSYKLQYGDVVGRSVISTAKAPTATGGDSPLDLTVRQVTMATTTSGGPITPPATPSPLKKRYREDNQLNVLQQKTEEPHPKRVKSGFEPSEPLMIDVRKDLITPAKPTAKTGTTDATVPNPPKSTKNPPAPAAPSGGTKERRAKAIRKLKFDEENSSPVSGTIIISLEEALSGDTPRESGDIDPQFNLVEVSDEVRAELAAIPNVIGGYNCKLCRLEFEDAFGLAQHRCSCIVLLEYRCPECGKRFNCPANLASHRRWHKPRDQVGKKASAGKVETVSSDSTDSDSATGKFRCHQCDKTFKRPAYLKKHQLTHNKQSNKTVKPASKRARSPSVAIAQVPYRGEDSNHSNHSSQSVESSSVVTYTTTIEELTAGSKPPPLTVYTTLASNDNGTQEIEIVTSGFYQDPGTVAFGQERAGSVVSSSGRGSVALDHDDDDDDDHDQESDCEERTLVINEDYRDHEEDDDDEMERQYRSAYCDRFTEEENLAAAALARLRNGPSVIRHTTALVV
ncbi:zinc finger protein 629 [Anopheles maculipalpis]|uniref:zinc finger protein 629 n=1 Tax=Anopheles maculipalpis TaxID=1496333 RepID=UPI0021591938|nr:zinc finger protein 629 [Anopheles maculipalpis]